MYLKLKNIIVFILIKNLSFKLNKNFSINNLNIYIKYRNFIFFN
jgi:hypothetical protein